MRSHYHVLFGLHGLYLPDTNVAFTNRRLAEQYAAELASKEAGETGEQKTGSARKGFLKIGNYCVEIAACSVADCVG
jgi:hypothetical protein